MRPCTFSRYALIHNQPGKVEVTEDDAQAVDAVFEYLYNLDYKDDVTQDLVRVDSKHSQNGLRQDESEFSVESPVVVFNGFDAPSRGQAPTSEPVPPPMSPKTEEPASIAGDSLDDFLPIKTLPKKRSKKKKANGTVSISTGVWRTALAGG